MIRSLFVFAALAASLGVSAAEWQKADGATLAFKGSYQGEAFEGRFERFEAKIVFDEAALEQARFEVTVELASATTGVDEYDSGMQEPEFFDSKRFPSARFVTKGFRKTGENAYEADAELAIRDKTRPIVFPFRFVRAGDGARLTATLTLKRLDFDVGTGDWSDTALIANEVEVKVDLPLKPGA